MKYPVRTKPRQWRRVRGRQILDVLFEINVHTAEVRVKKGRRIEIVDLRDFGLRPAIDTVKEKDYNGIDGN